MSDQVLEKKSFIVKSLEYFLAFSVGTTVIVVLWRVLARALVSLAKSLEMQNSSWAEFCIEYNSGTAELAQFLLVWLVMLGSAAAFHSKQHLGLDYFYANINPSSRKRIAYVGEIIVLFFILVILLFGGIRVVASSLQYGQEIQGLGIPKAMQFLAVPISGVYFLIFSCQNFAALKKRDFAAEDFLEAEKDKQEALEKEQAFASEEK